MGGRIPPGVGGAPGPSWQLSVRIPKSKGERMMTEATGTKEITLTRVFNAPCERVFAAWTDPIELGRWWGPDGFGTAEVVSEPHAGGTLKIVMKGPDFEQTMDAIYREVIVPKRIVVEA